jgi:hypothetical protein
MQGLMPLVSLASEFKRSTAMNILTTCKDLKAPSSSHLVPSSFSRERHRAFYPFGTFNRKLAIRLETAGHYQWASPCLEIVWLYLSILNKEVAYHIAAWTGTAISSVH